MKTFKELTDAQQEHAIQKCIVSLLENIVEGVIRFDDEANGTDIQARIDAAIDEAERMQTPWFAHQYVLKAIDAELSGMALGQATESLFPEAGEWVIEGVA